MPSSASAVAATILTRKSPATSEPVYGVTTGFGSLCNVSIGQDQLSQLQINLIKSHACGTGERVPNDIVKIMLLLKIQSLSYGYSGCKLDTVQRLIEFFNNDIYPVVYRQGSLGASGDLVPLAHLCLPLVGLGEVEYQGKVISGAEMLRQKRWKPIEMASKEGLALLNGTQNMSAFAVWALLQAQRLSDWADKIAAMSLDAFDGRIEPFTHAVHAVRPHLGQIETAKRMREMLEGSQIIKHQGARAGPLFLPLRAAGARSREGHHALREVGHRHRDQFGHRQPHRLPRRRPHHLGRQLPRRAHRPAHRLPLHRHERTGQHLRATHLPPGVGHCADCPISSWPIRD